MKWINVNDKNPKELKTILICDKESDLTISIGHRDEKGFYDWVDEEYVKVTHWCKIPKHPTE